MFNFWKSDYVILQFKVGDDENIFQIDINELIILNSIVTYDYFAMQIKNRLKQSGIINLKEYATTLENYMMNGIENRPYIYKNAFKSNQESFLEGHYPFLKVEDIVGVYENFDLEKSKNNGCIEKFELFDEAKNLKNLHVI